jgi:hypothetical protein
MVGLAWSAGTKSDATPPELPARAQLVKGRTGRPNLLRPDAFAPTQQLVQTVDPSFIVPHADHERHFTVRLIPPPICR